MSSSLIQLGGEAVFDSVPDPELDVRDELSVVAADRQRVRRRVAELSCGSALLGILHEERGGIVLRSSHAGAPLTVSAVALKRAPAEALRRRAVAVEADCHRAPS